MIYQQKFPNPQNHWGHAKNQEYLQKRSRQVQIKEINQFKIHDRYDRINREAYYDIAIVEIQGEFR